jgi:porphobilinogen synthase
MKEFKRHRRLRRNERMRNMVRETELDKDDLIFPIFVADGEDLKVPVPSMPGVYQWSLDRLDEELQEVVDAGISAVLLFGVPEHKDEIGTQAFADDGIVQKATAHIKKHYPQLMVVADTCLCEFTDHGHCGMIENGGFAGESRCGHHRSVEYDGRVCGGDSPAIG